MVNWLFEQVLKAKQLLIKNGKLFFFLKMINSKYPSYVFTLSFLNHLKLGVRFN